MTKSGLLRLHVQQWRKGTIHLFAMAVRVVESSQTDEVVAVIPVDAFEIVGHEARTACLELAVVWNSQPVPVEYRVALWLALGVVTTVE